MAEKYAGKFHVIKEDAKEKWGTFKEKGLNDSVKENVQVVKDKVITRINHGTGGDYDHLYRKKSRYELTKISAAVMGIEFSYAAETAFVSPTLLKIGVAHEHMTLIWCLSPMVGFFLTPVLGSLSDRCRSQLGRRRPFIILLSLGVVLGLILVPNGKFLGKLLGDKYPLEDALKHQAFSDPENEKLDYDDILDNMDNTTLSNQNNTPPDISYTHHPWGIFFTILGTVLLDFDADACQSPSRAYLLDVTVADDHAIGLSTFTIMAGLGGSMGYAMGAIDWGVISVLLGGHVRAVFLVVLVIFIICVFVTLTSFQEIPLDILTTPIPKNRSGSLGTGKYSELPTKEEDYVPTYGSTQTGHVASNPFVQSESRPSFVAGDEKSQYSANLTVTGPERRLEDKEYLQVQLKETSFSHASPVPLDSEEELTAATKASLKQYLWSIIYMPSSLKVLCLTNLFCWMSLVCYSLYFTDFVGEAVFGGDPGAAYGSEKRRLYDEGVQFGCWGMSIYSLSCSLYSFIIVKLVRTFRAKPVYVGGQLVYSIGMVAMAMTKSRWGVLVFSCSAGVMYSTLFTMPYLLVAHYHETDTFQCEDSWFLRQIRKMLSTIKEDRDPEQAVKVKTKEAEANVQANQVRGIGTDVAIVSCMVFLAQFILSLTMGSLISRTSTVAVVVAASVLSFCGAISANFVTYLDL